MKYGHILYMSDHSKKVEYNKYINHLWKKHLNGIIFPSANEHSFIRDISNVEKNAEEEQSHKPIVNKNTSNHKENLSKYFEKAKCKFIPTKILPETMVDDVFEELMKYRTSELVSDWNKIKSQFDDFSNYLLYSNVDTKAISKMFSDKPENVLNILIMGAGPTGLYIANYLNTEYNTTPFAIPKINLLIMDNRIAPKKQGYRMPYTRNRIFGLDPNLMNSFFPAFSHIAELIKMGGIQIKYLENLLITLIYGNKIPIYFTDKLDDESALKKFINKKRIDMVFDCTGGRFKNNFIMNPSKEMISNFFGEKIIFENDKYRIVPSRNEFVLQWKNNISNRFYLSLEIYDKQGKYVSTSMSGYELYYAHDVKFLSKFHNKCIKNKKNKIQSSIKIFDNIEDLYLSKQIQTVFLQYADKSIKFFIIEPKIFHKIIISSVIEQPQQDTLFIGIGDTVFSSHFEVGAGLNRMLPFIDRTIGYIPTLCTI